MKMDVRSDPGLAARLAFSAWIFLLSIGTLLEVSLKGPVFGAPGWLVLSVAGVEAASAVAFAVFPGGLALAGLCSSLSAASVMHIILGQTVWRLATYIAAAVFLYWLPHRTHSGDARHGQIRS
jgi:hypothetical protein